MDGHGYFVPLPQLPPKPDVLVDQVQPIIDLYAAVNSALSACLWHSVSNKSYKGKPLRVRAITYENGLGMRAIPFDFMNDSATYNINNQYMFGPSFLVNPVVEPLYYLPNSIKVEGSIEPDANTNTKLEVKADYYVRSVYLPKGTQWFDFWTGKNYEGGNTIKADARFETMPLFVKAGAIIPMGPFIQYSTEKTDPLEIRIYLGANGEFTIYEDENDNYNYEKGVYSLISFKWNDGQKTLTIDDRKGEFPGMLKKRTFNIVIVGEKSGTGVEIPSLFSKTITYLGEKIVVHF